LHLDTTLAATVEGGEHTDPSSSTRSTPAVHVTPSNARTPAEPNKKAKPYSRPEDIH
jgi:hypothetical protein